MLESWDVLDQQINDYIKNTYLELWDIFAIMLVFWKPRSRFAGFPKVHHFRKEDLDGLFEQGPKRAKAYEHP